jgi:uncharacterized protein YxjI
MEIKITCACGTRYKFDTEPHLGRMAQRVSCPDCNADGTESANAFIASQTAGAPVVFTRISAPAGAVAVPPPPPPLASGGLRLSGGASSSAAPASSTHESRALLERTTFFVKERVAMLKLTDTFDILDPANSQPIGVAREEPPSWAKWLRLLVNKSLLPTTVNIYEADGQPPVASVHRGFTFLRSKIKVVGPGGHQLGYFKSKLFSIGGGFYVFDNANNQVAEVKGNWKGWDFKFLNKGGREIGSVTKKWAGLGKELFTSADNYIISLSDMSGASPEIGALLLAAGLSIDIVFKESK